MPKVSFIIRKERVTIDYDDLWNEIYWLATNKGARGHLEWSSSVQKFLNCSDINNTELSKSQLRTFVSHFYVHAGMDKECFLELLKRGKHPIAEISAYPDNYPRNSLECNKMPYQQYLYETNTGKEIDLYIYIETAVTNIIVSD